MLRWMTTKGAKNFIVPSRSGAASGAAAELVAELTEQGVTIVTPKCDVSSKESLKQVLEECGKTMPPVKGCINAAMVLNVRKHQLPSAPNEHQPFLPAALLMVKKSWFADNS